MVNDSVSDFINRLKTTAQAGGLKVSAPYAKLLEAIAKKLEAKGFLDSVEVRGKADEKRTLVVVLSQNAQGRAKIEDVERMSKPGRRLYGGKGDMVRVRGGRGAMIVSTPKGILTAEEAKKENIGGELLFKVW